MNDDSVSGTRQQSFTGYKLERIKKQFGQVADSGVHALDTNMKMGNSNQSHHYNEPAHNQCIADLQLADPREEKVRIEQLQGGLHRPSYKWILGHQDYRKWRDDEQSRLLWIKGDAGMGKTMLLCGIIDELSQSRKSGGSLRNAANVLSQSIGDAVPWWSHAPSMPFFFCQSTDSRLNHATSVLRGLVYLLLCQYPSLISHLQDIYENRGRRVFEDDDALDTLSNALTSMLRDERVKDCYLIIVALDECQTGLQQLLEFILETSQLTNVKWVVSSRRMDEIEDALAPIDSEIRLCIDLNASIVSRGLSAYINHKMLSVKSIRCKRKFRVNVHQELRDRAEGSFLWVELVTHLLQNVRRSNVIRVVSMMPTSLSLIYERIMSHIESLDQENRRLCHAVLTLAITTYQPLSLDELTLFSGLAESFYADEVSMESVVKDCAPLLKIRDGFVYLAHASVREYLNKNSIGSFNAPPTAHYDMFSTCLHLMSKVLCRDVYGLQKPDTLRRKVSPPKSDPLAPVHYACLHWVDHLYDAVSHEDQNTIDVICNSVMIYTFLSQKYLNWIEALSLLHEMPQAVSMVNKLQKLVERGIMDNVAELVRDAQRFIVSNMEVVEMAPLQVYSSALLFGPRTSLVAMFETELPQWISAKTTIEIASGSSADSSQGDDPSLSSLSFSRDGQRIASVSHQNVVEIWDVATGQSLQTVKSLDRKVTFVTFLADGQQIALGFEGDDSIEIRDAAKNTCIRSLDGLGLTPTCTAFSADDEFVVLGSHTGSIMVCDANTGQLQHKMKSLGHVSSVTVSADSNLIASASGDNTIRIWDATTGQCIYELLTRRAVHSVAFDEEISSQLVTDMGIFDLTHLPDRRSGTVKVRSKSLKPFGFGIGTDETWLVKDATNLVWLPNDSRSVMAVGSGPRMARGCGSNLVTVIQFGSGIPDKTDE